MTRADIERVRRARRTEIGESDMEPPRVDPFEFFGVREKSENSEYSENSDSRKAVPGGEILAVGSYEPETERLEMAAWEDVSVFLRKEDE